MVLELFHFQMNPTQSRAEEEEEEEEEGEEARRSNNETD